MTMPPAAELGNPPQRLREGLWVFPPNRDCNGGTAWWLGCEPEPVLIDCPPLTKATIGALEQLSLGRQARILLTSREGHGRVRALQDALGWPVLVQEQEAYLLPGLTSLDSFAEEHTTVAGMRLLWTSGPTPGSCVVFAPHPWNVLFCGRLLIPVAFRQLAPLKDRRTFHWPRQLKSLEK
ncbi:MAG TPA: MBL fold metallo-hydrolase, partial [Prochlorococcaceae cyanobacterium Gl_MAG_24]|nr:MBL fold metallo-hydrolase [Prochlorococcaceae cyanobacterium Gl_MAG_24]